MVGPITGLKTPPIPRILKSKLHHWEGSFIRFSSLLHIILFLLYLPFFPMGAVHQLIKSLILANPTVKSQFLLKYLERRVFMRSHHICLPQVLPVSISTFGDLRGTSSQGKKNRLVAVCIMVQGYSLRGTPSKNPLVTFPSNSVDNPRHLSHASQSCQDEPVRMTLVASATFKLTLGLSGNFTGATAPVRCHPHGTQRHRDQGIPCN